MCVHTCVCAHEHVCLYTHLLLSARFSLFSLYDLSSMCVFWADYCYWIIIEEDGFSHYQHKDLIWRTNFKAEVCVCLSSVFVSLLQSE